MKLFVGQTALGQLVAMFCSKKLPRLRWLLHDDSIHIRVQVISIALLPFPIFM